VDIRTARAALYFFAEARGGGADVAGTSAAVGPSCFGESLPRYPSNPKSTSPSSTAHGVHQ
jgi:hypothetical protein